MSIIAAVLSFISYRLSKKEYNLQLRLYSEGAANFNFKVIDACIKDNKEYDRIQYWFNLLITNLSDKPTSILEYVLRLDCLTGIVYRPEYVMPDDAHNFDIAFLNIPQNIDTHNSIKGWCIFELPRKTFNELDIESCIITLKDIHGKMDFHSPIYIKEELINYDI